MTDKRSVTIGVTISLGNYENLRLEVSDNAETKTDCDNLRRFLSDVLDGFGNNNASAKLVIDKYKDKILADSSAEEPVSDIYYDLPTADEIKSEPDDDFEKEVTETVPPIFDEVLNTEPVIDEDAEPEPVSLFAEPEPVTEPETETEPPKVSVPISKPSEGEYTCEKCGAKISKVQRDVSNLFMGKTLCKNCMK